MKNSPEDTIRCSSSDIDQCIDHIGSNAVISTTAIILEMTSLKYFMTGKPISRFKYNMRTMAHTPFKSAYIATAEYTGVPSLNNIYATGIFNILIDAIKIWCTLMFPVACTAFHREIEKESKREYIIIRHTKMFVFSGGFTSHIFRR